MSTAKFNDGMEIIYQDFNRAQKLAQKEMYERVLFELIQRAENAFFDDGFLASYVTPTSISLNAGVGFQTDNTQISPESKKRLLYFGSNQTVNLTPADPVNDRIDIVCVKHNYVDTASDTRKFKDAGTGVISNQNFQIEQDWLADKLVVDGTPAITPVAPATPAGYIKVAECYMNAVTGLSGSGDVTDTRVLMPLGGALTLNTLGKVRVTAGAAVPLSTLITDIDTLLKYGYQNYTDYDVLGADPAVPGVSKVRLYHKGGVWYSRENGGTITPLGSGGGGGGGGANWQPNAGAAPTEDFTYYEKTWLFEQGLTQVLTLWVRVPSGYLAGRKIQMLAGFFSSSAANQWKMQTTATLIRKNNDAITSTTNQEIKDSGDITNAVANRLREITIDLTSATGTINSVAVSAGDLIKIDLTRIAPSGSEDTADINFIPSSTEVKFG